VPVAESTVNREQQGRVGEMNDFGRDLRQLNTRQVLVAPSLLAANFAELGDELEMVTAAGADVLHIDVMDGHFVPNLSMGPGIVESLRPLSALPFDVHLMLSQPARYVTPFVSAGADHITVHVEAEDDVVETVALIHAEGCSAGLSLKPRTPAEALFPYLPLIDLVLVMTVEPGFGGQSFMADQMAKVRALRRAIDQGERPIHLEVDGGINAQTAKPCIEAGANLIVAGTSVFRNPAGMAAAIRGIRGR
jgi:ribulose-phosphate 3-epimerase